jgi:hypothetical protein
MADNNARNGYRVIGNNTTDGKLHAWYFPDLPSANAFAQTLCQTTGKEVEVAKYVGSWRQAAPPTEFVEATDFRIE